MTVAGVVSHWYFHRIGDGEAAGSHTDTGAAAAGGEADRKHLLPHLLLMTSDAQMRTRIILSSLATMETQSTMRCLQRLAPSQTGWA